MNKKYAVWGKVDGEHVFRGFERETSMIEFVLRSMGDGEKLYFFREGKLLE